MSRCSDTVGWPETTCASSPCSSTIACPSQTVEGQIRRQVSSAVSVRKCILWAAEPRVSLDLQQRHACYTSHVPVSDLVVVDAVRAVTLEGHWGLWGWGHWWAKVQNLGCAAMLGSHAVGCPWTSRGAETGQAFRLLLCRQEHIGGKGSFRVGGRDGGGHQRSGTQVL